MRPLAHLFAFGILLSTLIPYAAAQPISFSPPLASLNHQDGMVLTKSRERVVLAASDMQHGVELLAGRQAVDYLLNLKAKHPDRFDKMGQHLSKHGYVPTNRVTVARLVRFVPVESKQPSSDPNLRLAESTSTSQGVVVTQSWDDGDDATWEGTFYVQRYTDGAWATYEAQLDIATSDYEVIWAEAIAGGGGPGGDPFPVSLNQPTGGLDNFSLAALRRHSASSQSRATATPCFLTLPAQPWFQDFTTCLVSGSAGCATACALTGVGWADCTAACSAGVFVTCALQTLLK